MEPHPVTQVLSLTVAQSDPNPTNNDTITSTSSEDNLILSQPLKLSSSQPRVPDAPSLSSRRKSMPTRYEDYHLDMQMNLSSSVVSDPLSRRLSLQKQRSPTKSFETSDQSSPAMIRATEVQRSLGSEFPTCVKMMLRSQVKCGFWLGLPLEFGKSFLPQEDVPIVLEDEEGEKCEVKYIAYKCGISAGWKNFALGHNLKEGDVLLFHLVEATKFKVYIYRASDSNEVVGDVPVGLLNLGSHSEQITPVAASARTKKNKQTESFSSTEMRKGVKKPRKSVPLSRSIPPGGHLIKHLGNDNDKGGSEALACSSTSKRYLLFHEVESFEDFQILVNGLSIDSELPDDVRMVYYKLCIYKKQFLHDGLQEGLYDKFVVGMIGETVRIANEIKTCKLTTKKEEFERWDNSLKSMELLGMNVVFLRDKISALVIFLFESEGASDVKRYAEAKSEHQRVKDELSRVATKLRELEESAKKLEGISGILEQKVEKYEQKLKEDIDALW